MSETNGHKSVLHFENPPQRVVSLVPSLTESLFDLGFGEAVVGITDYCVHPAERLAGLPRLGGPKNPRIDEIIQLKPDLVLANQEENTRQAVEALEAAGVPVWVSFPQTTRQALDVLWSLTHVFRSGSAAVTLMTLEQTLAWCEEAAQNASTRYFCPIWQGETSGGVRWWMTFNQQTYAHDVLRLSGGTNIFAARERRYPLSADLGLAAPEPGEDSAPEGRDTRYPRVRLEEIQAADPEVILLPSEPFAFDESHREEISELLAGTSAVKAGRVHLVDGSLITWHGTRLARALRELPELFVEG